MKIKIILLLVAFLTMIGYAESGLIIRGYSAFSQNTIEQQLNLPDEFSEIKNSRQKFFVLMAKANIEFLYLNEGYFNVKINILDSASFDGSEQFHIIDIVENAQFRYSTIQLTIPDSTKMLITYDDLDVYPLKKYTFEDIEADLTYINNTYRENGYLHVSVQHIIILDTINSTLELRYKVEPGAQVKFGEMIIECAKSKTYIEKSSSNTGISSTKFIRSMWKKQPGEVIDNNYFDDFRSKLLGTQLFSQVTLIDSLDPNDPNNLSIIRVKLVEKAPGSIKLRLFYEQLYGFGTSSEFRYKNFGGRFHEGWVSLLYAQHKARGAVGYANPLLFNTPIRFENEVSILKDSLYYNTNGIIYRKTYSIQNKGKLSRRITDNILLKGIVNLKNEDVTEEHTDNEKPLESDEIKLSIELGSNFDFVDNPISPDNGLRVGVSIGNGGTFKSSERYLYSKIEFKGYKKLNHIFQLAGAVDYGTFFQPGDEIDSRAFDQGGSRSVRGYVPRSIKPSRIAVAFDTSSTSPIVIDTTFSNGRQPSFVRASMELRITPPFKAVSSFQVVPYFDWANVWDADENHRKGEETALGLGLRWKLQVLTIRVDYTFKKDLKRLFDFSNEEWESQRLVIDLMQAI